MYVALHVCSFVYRKRAGFYRIDGGVCKFLLRVFYEIDL